MPKVMFLHVSVILFRRGGAVMSRGVSIPGEWVCPDGGTPSGGRGGHPGMGWVSQRKGGYPPTQTWDLGYPPPAPNIWWLSLETCSNLFTWICTISAHYAKCGIHSTLCWKVGNISGPT